MPSPEARAWFCRAVRTYEADASAGMDLDRAFGLTPAPGQESWWTIEARHARDQRIRQLRRDYFGDLGVTEAARAIARLADKRRRVVGRNEREGTGPEALIDAVIDAGAAFPGPRHLENILRNEL